MPSKKPAAAKLEARKKEPLRTYGCLVTPDQCPIADRQLFYNLYAFCWRIPLDKGAPRRIDLFKDIADVLSPNWFEWHDWTERTIEAMCENKWIALCGCSGAAKTRNAIGYACTWWMANPAESSVIICSTTAKAMKSKCWAEVQRFYTSIPGPRFGTFIDSQMLWKVHDKDDKHVIMGIAVEEGSMTKVADNIKGRHTKRQMVIIDEGTAVPPAIFDACSNLYAYPSGYPNGEFVLVIIGNPRGRMDTFGKFIEPLNGWKSVTVEDQEWETKPQLDGNPGIVVRFDAEKSPNILAGQIVSKHLPMKSVVEKWRNKAGSQDEPTYWSNMRGFPPPDGLAKTVFSESSIITHNGMGQHKFTGANFQIIGAFDPARTGDKPMLRFGALGEIRPGVMGLEMMPPIIVPVNANSTNPIDYQLVEQVKRECERVKYRGQEYNCRPEHFGIDATGGGADLCDVAQRIWSPKINRVLFSGEPGIEQCSHEDVRPANEVYHNRRAEMYFRARHFLDSEQLRGFDAETAKEICTIEFIDENRPRIILIAKKDYRKTYGKSPDASDSVVIMVDVARRMGMRLAVLGQTVEAEQVFHGMVEASQAVFQDVDYREQDDFEEEEEEPIESLY